ncbi:MAG TPA: hypothetical protein VMX94_08420 [Armatimonadota bacterium]|nr:hypothetical protein [Armatimonadota bacterium]
MQERGASTALKAIQALYLILTVALVIGLYFDPLKSRAALPGADVLFWALCAVGIGDLVAMRIIPLRQLRSARFASPESGPGACPGPATAGLIAAAFGFSTLFYPAIFYCLGGPVGKALVLAGISAVGYIQLLTLLPKYTAESGG